MNVNGELEPLTVYHYKVSAAMDNLIRYVLTVIPDNYSEKFPSFSVFGSPSKWGAHVEEDGKIFCDSSLLELPKNIAVGTLAHEFAHVYLGHAGKGGIEDEYEADVLAYQWGFAKEIAAMRERFGPPSDDKARKGIKSKPE